MPDLLAHVFRDAGAAAKGDVEQKVKLTVGAEASVSAAIERHDTTAIKFVRLWADEDCFVVWGEDPTADDTDIPIGGGHGPEYFEIPAGYKLSVIEKAAS